MPARPQPVSQAVVVVFSLTAAITPFPQAMRMPTNK